MKCSKCGKEDGRKKNEQYKSEAWLHEEYVTKRRSMDSMALECSVTPMTINNWLKRFDIRTRGRGVRSGLFDI
tara:strand:+ start:368 stop:586 length:219 start_codon:yes stop_codon:yes gene_type:complete